MKSHQERLQLLKHKGFNPRVIYDIGAFRGDWSYNIHTVFPSSEFFLFEANKNNEPYLKNKGFPYFIETLGHSNHQATLTSIAEKNAISLPDLIKIDAQETENSIIANSETIVCHAEVIILEKQSIEDKNTLIYDALDLMHKLGYQMMDIINHHYIQSLDKNEIDILFIKTESNLLKTRALF